VVQHITLAGAQISVNGFEQGRLAGAVGTDDAMNLTFLDFYRNSVEGRDAA
jgi:hypothetical protein